MHELMEFFKEFNVQTMMSIGVIMWYFTRDIKKEIAAIHSEIRGIHKDQRFMDIRTSRREGTVYGKDLYKQGE